MTGALLPLLLFLLFLFLIVMAGLRSYYRIPAELADLANGAGVTLKRSWACPRTSIPDSPLLFNGTFTGTYRDWDVIFSPVVNDQGNVLGASITFPFQRPLSLALFCTENIAPFSAKDIRDEYRDLYMKRVETEIETMQAWANDRGQAEFLLKGGDVHEKLVNLCAVIRDVNRSASGDLPGLRQVGFVINDSEVILLVTTPVPLPRNMFDITYALAQALSGTAAGSPKKQVSTEHRGIILLAIVSLTLFILFIMGVIVAGIFKVDLASILLHLRWP